MMRASFIRLAGVVFFLCLFAQFAARAQSGDDIAALNSKLAQLYQQGKYSEAAGVAEKVLTLTEQALGPDHPHTLRSAGNLAAQYLALGRYDEAEPLFERALAGYEKVLGATHPDTLTGVNNLAGLYSARGRYAKAEPLFRRALAGSEKTLGPEHPGTLSALNNLGVFYSRHGRYLQAQPLLDRALAGYEKVLGAQHPATLQTVNSLGFLYTELGRYEQAERLYNRALAGYELAVGPEHPDTLNVLNNLGYLFWQQGRYAQAEPLYKRALASRVKALGPENPQTLRSANNLGALYESQARYAEAEKIYAWTLSGRMKRLGAEHPDTLQTIHNLAAVYSAQNRFSQAEPLYKQALDGREKALGPDHPETLISVSNLAALYSRQGRYADAEPLLKRTLARRETVLGEDHPETLISVNNLASFYFEQAAWRDAAKYWKRSTDAIAARARRDALSIDLAAKKTNEAERFDWQFSGLLKASYRLEPQGRFDAASADAAFKTAQWVLSSETARSLAQMAARGAKGEPGLAKLVRERQDLVDEWQAGEKTQTSSLGRDAAKRDANAEADNRKRMAAIDRRVAEIDERLKTGFPDYFVLSSPEPLSVQEAQTLLGAGEALVLFLDTPESKPTPEETFIWVVTKTQMRWLRSDLGREALVREVQALRCGLDNAAWQGQSRCPELTGQKSAGALLPYDPARAHRLYKALFGEIEAFIKDKHLLIVPSGALTQLPFSVLVSAPPDAGGKTAWLIRDHAITVLPAVSSLKALRAIGHPSAATKPLIGFGNPLLEGGGKDSPGAKLAREMQSCAKTEWERVSALFGLRSGVQPIETRGVPVKVSDIRRQSPLPETADELCNVARGLGADLDAVHLGGRATEREIKALSEQGELAKYRVIHFATHGAMAGELDMGSEPGLILTPPGEASDADDGYLSASEIAGLKLDADWVILSACNTAAGQASNAEALSGLARAFIYAQARALLVSHWSVDSRATVKLITSAMHEIARDKTVGRAEALRRAALGMLDGADMRETHPAFWAPFIVVGEGSP